MLRLVNRRECMACVAASALVPVPALAGERRYPICSAVDGPVPPPRAVAVPGRPAPMMVQASVDHGQLWRRFDGATPDTGRITLNIAFIGGTPTQRAEVRRIAQDWINGHLGSRFSFVFDQPLKQSHIRIGFGGGTSWSKIGREALDPASRSKPTMVLSNVREPASKHKSGNRRDILHEFGHMLGLKHEHQHPNSGIRWNRRRVISDMAARACCTPAQCEENIFKRFGQDCVCTGDSKPDMQSVMLYAIDPSWTLDHLVVPLNTRISPRDRACLEREYGV